MCALLIATYYNFSKTRKNFFVSIDKLHKI